MNITSESEDLTLIQQNGWLTKSQAIKKLGVSVAYFTQKISPVLGTYISQKKYFKESELDKWVKENFK